MLVISKTCSRFLPISSSSWLNSSVEFASFALSLFPNQFLILLYEPLNQELHEIKLATTLGSYFFLLIHNSSIWYLKNVTAMATLLSLSGLWTSQQLSITNTNSIHFSCLAKPREGIWHVYFGQLLSLKIKPSTLHKEWLDHFFLQDLFMIVIIEFFSSCNP